MSAGTVDVLVTMEVAAKRLRAPGTEDLPAGPLTADELDSARDAVQALVDAAKALGERASKDRAGLITVYASDVERLAVALRGIGGAA